MTDSPTNPITDIAKLIQEAAHEISKWIHEDTKSLCFYYPGTNNLEPIITRLFSPAMTALREENERLKAEVLSWREGVEIERKPARELGKAIAELEQRAKAAEAEREALEKDKARLLKQVGDVINLNLTRTNERNTLQQRLATAEAELATSLAQQAELNKFTHNAQNKADAAEAKLATAEADKAKALESTTVWKNRALMLSDIEAEARTLRERVAQAIKDIKAEEDLSRGMARGTCNKDCDAWQHWCGRLRGLEIALIHTRELTPPASGKVGESRKYCRCQDCKETFEAVEPTPPSDEVRCPGCDHWWPIMFYIELEGESVDSACKNTYRRPNQPQPGE